MMHFGGTVFTGRAALLEVLIRLFTLFCLGPEGRLLLLRKRAFGH